MLTAFGQFCRKLRIDKNQIMRDMAETLGVSAAFLSAVENGKRNIPKTWSEQLIDIYKMSTDEQRKLHKAIDLSLTEVKINLTEEKPSDRELIVTFAKEFKTLDEVRKEEIKKLLCESKGR